MPFQLPLENLPMTDTLKFFIYIFLGVGFIVFIYKNLIKDIIELIRKNKKEIEVSCCQDEYLTEHGFFKMVNRYIKIDLDRIFDLNYKKDAQFYLLGRCMFVSFYDMLNELVNMVLKNEIIFKGKKVEKIDFKMMVDMREETNKKYEEMFLSNGGKYYVLKKFNEYNERRSSGILEMFNYLSEQDFFNKDNRNIVMGLLTVYMYAFVQTYEDLKEDHRKINGSLNAELENFDLSIEFIKRAKLIDISK